MYPSVKSKCHDTTRACSGRVCPRQAHSCCRKIVSFASWPCREQWKSIGRAVETLTKRYCEQGELWRLKDAAPQLQEALRNFAPPAIPERHTCAGCRRRKPVWSGLVADAGQMFESISAAEVTEAFAYVCNRAEASLGLNTITVVRSAQRRAFLGGACVHRSRESTTYYFNELQACLKAFMRMSLASVGDAVAEMSGIPIGGFLSKAAASCRLCVAEAKWAAAFHDPLPWHESVAARRYVDDLLMVSHRYCRGCLAAFVSRMYPVKFDIPDAGRVLSWLDMTFDLDRLQVGMLYKRYVTPPAWASDTSFLHSYVLGRLARWRELSLDTEQLLDHAARMVVDLKEQGWQARAFRQVYFATEGREECKELKVFRAALKIAFRREVQDVRGLRQQCERIAFMSTLPHSPLLPIVFLSPLALPVCFRSFYLCSGRV